MGTSASGTPPMEVLLVLSGFELSESVDEQERVLLAVAPRRSPHGWRVAYDRLREAAELGR
jgi:hypothetical protein